MTRGRKPKPVPIRVLEGNRSKRPLPVKPEPKGGPPTCPKWLPTEAKKFWRQHAKKLEETQLLTALDGPGFEMMCFFYWLAIEAARQIREEGLLQLDDSVRRKHPAFQILRDANRELKAWFAEYGLTPAARTRLDIRTPVDDEEDDDLARFLT